MMKSKTTITLSIAAIAAAALLFATGPIVGNQQALAYGWGGGISYDPGLSLALVCPSGP
jgi:hypothetical protein